jgi:hypothetical protein
MECLILADPRRSSAGIEQHSDVVGLFARRHPRRGVHHAVDLVQ